MVFAQTTREKCIFDWCANHASVIVVIMSIGLTKWDAKRYGLVQCAHKHSQNQQHGLQNAKEDEKVAYYVGVKACTAAKHETLIWQQSKITFAGFTSHQALRIVYVDPMRIKTSAMGVKRCAISAGCN